MVDIPEEANHILNIIKALNLLNDEQKPQITVFLSKDADYK